MGPPLRDIDKAQLLLEQIERVNALAVANDIEPLNLGPLARMSINAAIHHVHNKNNEVIVALGGEPITWGGPLKDPAAAAAMLDASMDYTDTLSGAGEDAPVLSNLIAFPDSDTEISFTVISDTAGEGEDVISWVASLSAEVPSVADIYNGQDADGAAPVEDDPE